MKKINWKTLITALLIPVLTGILSGVISMSSNGRYNELELPSFAPPGWLFPIVWTILYALMGLASYFIMIEPESQQKKRCFTSLLFPACHKFFLADNILQSR